MYEAPNGGAVAISMPGRTSRSPRRVTNEQVDQRINSGSREIRCREKPADQAQHPGERQGEDDEDHRGARDEGQDVVLDAT